ncbi:MAG: lipid-A-disaccharide synthase [Verrucomicrobia bacterium]|nr:lipid-A-disaccharide synthase [Verrucomicrobiota bacterium]
MVTFVDCLRAPCNGLSQHQPKVVCLVDYPGFNLRLAKAMYSKGLSRKGGGKTAVYMYISPQIWAWKAKRRFSMQHWLDELGVIFPFELECYADTSLPVQFVGHPFVASDYRSPVSYAADGGLLLLPGSRSQAVARIFPSMLAALQLLRPAFPDLRAYAVYPDEALRTQLEQHLQQAGVGADTLSLVSTVAVPPARAVMTSSGTMSLHCALAGIPGLVVYRAHPLTYWMGKRLVKVPFLGIANLLLNEPLYREYLQSDATPAQLAEATGALLRNKDNAAVRFQQAAGQLRGLLQGQGAVSVAQRLLDLSDVGVSCAKNT